MQAAPFVRDVLRKDAARWHLLGVVAELDLPDCWIAAGFVRNAVWDALHGRRPNPQQGDVDVIWFDPDCLSPEVDREYEEQLRLSVPSIEWSVKKQARMHLRNGDAPYRSATDAMRYWPETATAVAARRQGFDQCEIAAPLGLDDLLQLALRPTSRFVTEKREIFDQRVKAKAWMLSWPNLEISDR